MLNDQLSPFIITYSEENGNRRAKKLAIRKTIPRSRVQRHAYVCFTVQQKRKAA